MKTFLNFQQRRFGIRLLNDVSVIDVSSDIVIATIAGAERPTTVAIQPNTKDDLTEDANNQ